MTGRWFRTDIEGIRGLAMIMVLLAHAGFGFAEGGYIGLDLFFVISGFLITTLLLREYDRTGTISISKFYARRIRRLLPAAALVLVTIVVLSNFLFSPARNALVAGDVLAALVYVVNWRFAQQSVDYFAQGFEASPVQHFWSLAVEEQFYLLWPLLLLGTLLLALRFAAPGRALLGALVAAIGLASLAYSGWFTPISPGEAYFSTLTRVWELALGALLAIARLPELRPRAAGTLAGLGLAAIIASFFWLDETTPFPGLIALVPTLGAAAIIVAGTSSLESRPLRLLSSEPLQHVGRVSYCWYLWHWPALIFAGAVLGALSPWAGLAVVAAAWVPAYATHRLVEQPVLRSETLALRPRRALAVLAAGSGTAAVAAVALAVSQPSLPVAPAAEVRGALALDASHEVQRRASALRPEAERAFEDRTRLVEDGCFVKLGEVEHPECAYGEPGSGTTVVLFGDSHGEHYFPALEHLARRKGWRLVALTKSFCSPAQVEQSHPNRDEPFTDCHEWRQRALERIVERERPRLVLVGGSRRITPVRDGRELEGGEARRALAEGYVETLRRIREGGSQVAVLTDVPQAPHDVPECVSENPDRLAECAFEPGDRPDVEQEASRRVDGAHLVDTAREVCAGGVCRAVIGDAIVYRDRGHLTATFAATLAPAIERQLPRVN